MKLKDFQYRVWDKKYKEYLEFDANVFELENTKNYKVELYTGIKDRNGLEIFEGDIILYFPTKYAKELRYIEFREGAFFLNLPIKHFDGVFKKRKKQKDESMVLHMVVRNRGLEKGRLKVLEVIGNIHENKSLTNKITNFINYTKEEDG